jgi:maleylpyruvate isomerase
MDGVVRVDLEADADRASALCRAAHQRLVSTVVGLTDDDVASRSRLPGWTIGHVLTHLARNADGHARRLAGALRGEDVPKYAGGAEQRAREIDEGAVRPASEIVADLRASQDRLEELIVACASAGWPEPESHDGGYGPRGCPAHRLREVEMHHVDLGLGYGPEHWSDDYVAWDLDVLLSTVSDRLREPLQRRHLMAWLAGRGSLPTEVSLGPWG